MAAYIDIRDDRDSRARSVPGDLSLSVRSTSTSLSENHVKFLSWKERESAGSTDLQVLVRGGTAASEEGPRHRRGSPVHEGVLDSSAMEVGYGVIHRMWWEGHAVGVTSDKGGASSYHSVLASMFPGTPGLAHRFSSQLSSSGAALIHSVQCLRFHCCSPEPVDLDWEIEPISGASPCPKRPLSNGTHVINTNRLAPFVDLSCATRGSRSWC